MSSLQKKKSIVFLCLSDYANVRTHMAYLINQHSKKYTAKVIGYIPHCFNYQVKHDYDISEKRIVRGRVKWVVNTKIIPVIEKIVADADIIYWAEEHQRTQFVKLIPQLLPIIGQKKRVIGHSGSFYRNHCESSNQSDVDFFQYQVLNTDLYRLSPVDKKIPFIQCCLVSPVSKQEILMKYGDQKKLIICHLPYNRKKKGSNIIDGIVAEIMQNNHQLTLPQIEYYYQSDSDHNKILQLKKKVHLYIDQYNLSIGGLGVSTLESLASGSIVFCSLNQTQDIVWNQLGIEKPPIIDIGFPIDQVKKIILNILQLPTKELIKLSYKSVKWYNQYLRDENYVQLIERTIFDRL